MTSPTRTPREAGAPADTESPKLDCCSWQVQIAGATLVVLALFFTVQFTAPEAGGGLAEDALPPVKQAALAHPASLLLRGDVRADGEQIYQSRCASCHQMNGQGMSTVFPPVDGSEWVTGDKGRLIRILLHGISGKIKVKGQTYSGVMPPWGSSLDNEQIAQLTTYMRSSWSNDTTAVTVDEVARVRAATKDRSRPWNAKALKQEANTGVPEASSSDEE